MLARQRWIVPTALALFTLSLRPVIAQAPPAVPGGNAQFRPVQGQAAARAPFTLNPQQQARVDQILQTWEQQSSQVKSFKCTFTRWDYDKTFGPLKNDHLLKERMGEIKYRSPDNGTIKENKMKIYDGKSAYVDTKEELEHWMCDGDAIYQFVPKEKQLKVTKLPPDMRGKAITEGPLPFVFGAKADSLKERYWIRETTPREQADKQIWLEAWPKHAAQAADLQRCEVILTLPDMLPLGIQIYHPGGNEHSAYAFDEDSRVVNDPLAILRGDFLPPMTPWGWKKVVEDPTKERPAPTSSADRNVDLRNRSTPPATPERE